jgi:hypothetical protein
MSEFKPVTISKGAFAFCRYTIAAMIWAALLFQIRELVFAGFIILLLSYLLKVKRAPLIVLYSLTIDKLVPSNKIVVDEKGIRFAHLVGTVFCGICCILLYYVNIPVGWALTFLLAIMKTSAAFGFCSALKLYGCMTGGSSCCRMGRMIKRHKNV